MYARIRDLREENSYSQSQIAQILSVSQTTYSRYETGDLGVSAEVLIKLADFYQVSTDYILGRTDYRKIYPPAK